MTMSYLNGWTICSPLITTRMTIAFVMLSFAAPVLAVPSFAQQTGQPCATCHVGAFGPQLTPFGRAFKLGGYTLAVPDANGIPLALMLVESYTHTKTDQPDGAGPHAGPNDNFSLQQASLFLAGRLSEHIGVFAQTTYSDIDRLLTVDNIDGRYAHALKIGEKPVVLGISVNNNPTVQDVWNTIPAWRFPYMASGLVPTQAGSTLIDGGLQHQVIGASGYAFYDNTWYAELGGYRSLSHSFLDSVNVDDSIGRVSGVAPYWRVAYSHDSKDSSWSLGGFGLNANLQPNHMPGPTDKYRDVGLDGSLQLFGTGQHVWSLYGAYIHEHQNRDASFAAGASEHRSDKLDSASLNASYYYEAHYGLTLGRFNTRGSRDQGLFAAAPGSGSRTGSPNTSGTTIQADWTPFGAKDSWAAPWANVRIGLQYTVYDKFNGAKHDYDGFGRSAHDNNTLFLFLWLAI